MLPLHSCNFCFDGGSHHGYANSHSTEGPRLRSSCLNFWEILAQAIALISPTMTAALIVPVMYANAGNGSWLAYAFGTVMLLFVALNLNQFARRSTSVRLHVRLHEPGPWPDCRRHRRLVPDLGLPVYRHRRVDRLHELRERAAGHGAYSGSADFAVRDLRRDRLVCRRTETFRSPRLSCWCWKACLSRLILLLAVCRAVPSRAAGGPCQLTLKGASLSNMGFGVVVAIFSLVGFECATAFGDEAKNPLKTIPRAVIWSLLLTGAVLRDCHLHGSIRDAGL